MTAALPYGAIGVHAVETGRASRTRGGGLAAVLEVQVIYSRGVTRQVRQSQVRCQLNAAGWVIALQ